MYQNIRETQHFNVQNQRSQELRCLSTKKVKQHINAKFKGTQRSPSSEYKKNKNKQLDMMIFGKRVKLAIQCPSTISARCFSVEYKSASVSIRRFQQDKNNSALQCSSTVEARHFNNGAQQKLDLTVTKYSKSSVFQCTRTRITLVQSKPLVFHVQRYNMKKST